MITKFCTKCGERKESSLKDFYKCLARKDGLRSECKVCTGLSAKKYTNDNPEKVRERQKRWYKEHQIECSEVHKKWYGGHRIECMEASKKWYKENTEKSKKLCKQWREAHRLEHSEMIKKWNEKNPDKVKAIWKRAASKSQKTISGKLISSIKSGMATSLRGSKNGRSWEGLVGYTVDDLKKHLENLFKQEMTWENYGRNGWHIDHKTPKTAFNFEKPEDVDFKRCWMISNLQPMWAIDNLRKGNKLTEPHQPSLLI